MKLLDKIRSSQTTTFWTWPATLAVAGFGALLSGVAGELVITVFDDKNVVHLDKLWSFRLLIAIGLLVLLTIFVQAQRWRKRSRGTFYYVEALQEGRSRRDFSAHRELAEGHALSSCVLIESIPFARGAIDVSEPVRALTRAMTAELNADDDSTSFNIACVATEPVALTIGYCVPIRPNTRLFELEAGPEREKFMVPYDLPSGQLSLNDYGTERVRSWTFQPSASPDNGRKYAMTPVEVSSDNGAAVQRVLLTVRARGWESADFSIGECFDSTRKLPDGVHFDRCIVIGVSEFQFVASTGGLDKRDREWAQHFKHVDPEAFMGDVLGIVDGLRAVYERYPRAMVYLDLRMESMLSVAVGDALSRIKWKSDGLRDFWERTVFLQRVRTWLDGAIRTHVVQPDPTPYFDAWRGPGLACRKRQVWAPDSVDTQT